MADTYTTEAIACGLSDVAGWLESEGLVLVPRRAAREQVMAWFHDRLGDPDQRRLIESIYETMVAASPVACGLAAPPGHIPMPRTVDEAKAMWLLGERYVRDNAPDQIPAAPSHPGEADRVGLSEGEIVKLIAKTWLTAKGTDDETADEISDPGELAMISPEDYAACVEIAQTLLHRFSHPQAPNTLSEVEEAMLSRAHAEGIVAADWTQFTHEQSLAIRQKYLPAALATLRASQEQDSEVRRG